MKKILAYVSCNILSAPLSLLALVLLVHFLSTADFGKGTFFFSITYVIYNIANLGLDRVYALRFYKSEDFTYRLSLLLTTFFAFNVSFLILFLVALPLKSQVMIFLLNQDSTKIYLLLWFCGYLIVSKRFMMLTLRMADKFKAYNIESLIRPFLYLSAIVVLYGIGVHDFKLIPYAEAFSLIVTNIVLFITLIYLAQFHKRLNYSVKIDFGAIFGYLKLGIPFLFSMNLLWLLGNIDRFFIVRFSGYIELGLYAIAYVMTEPVAFAQRTFTTFWVPYRNKLLYQNQRLLKENLTRISSAIIFYFYVCFVSLFIFSKFAEGFLTQKYLSALHVFLWLFCVFFFIAITEVTVSGLRGSEKNSWQLLLSAVALIVNVALCFVLVPLYGAKGAAISIAFSYLCFFVVTTIVSMRFLFFAFPFVRFLLMVLSLFLLLSSYYYIALFFMLLYFSLALLKKDYHLLLPNREVRGHVAN